MWETRGISLSLLWLVGEPSLSLASPFGECLIAAKMKRPLPPTFSFRWVGGSPVEYQKGSLRKLAQGPGADSPDKAFLPT